MTTISKKEFETYITGFDFRGLFIEMGWNNDKAREEILVDNVSYSLQSAAGKSEFKIFTCAAKSIPPFKTRRAIEDKITKLYHNHLVIFYDEARTEQVWLLVTRRLQQRLKVSEVSWQKGKSCELLYQRASGLVFEMDDEGKITIVDVTALVSSQFNQNAEKVTKKFYERFRKEHDSFEKFIKGIEDKVNRDWYASLMLNRLMFCYFIQKRGFLNNDMDYLRNKLKECAAKHGKDKFYSFYRNFLLILFHQGLGAPVHSGELTKEIGRIPYLNGGLFDTHEIETAYPKIDIADEAFAAIFRFFDEYTWHLDTRPEAAGNEINPDVIGYIFEKYINDRAAMGAYYTKEDITGYIAKNCIIPRLFDMVYAAWPHPFTRDGEAWRFLKRSGDAYIYDAVKHGINREPREQNQRIARIDTNNINDLDIPENIKIGLDASAPDLLERRKDWNTAAPSDFGLPTEIWRETIARWNRYFEIRGKIAAGEIRHINDFITYNLDIRQFAQDLIEETDDAGLVAAFWDALTSVTILDPTCGSGAFLFAALNILEPLYEACIMRMRGFVEDEDRENAARRGSFKNEYKRFREILADIQNPERPNQRYYIYKTIILRGLYGVDLMKEAVEIAKLRLFLKLVAAVDADYRKPNLGLEPLPDIDFNIRAGNTLVGFASRAEVEKAFAGEIGFNQDKLDAILEDCKTLSAKFKMFQDVQLSEGAEGYSSKKIKTEVQRHLDLLREKLDRYLALVYGVETANDANGREFKKNNKQSRFAAWKAAHQPFHWFAEFYRIIAVQGGFDVVIGNPPYVEYSGKKLTTNLTNLTNNYRIMGYKTESCGNLYAFVVERALAMANKDAACGMIVPISLPSTPRMKPVRDVLSGNSGSLFVANFADRPGTVFSGVHQKVCIFISRRQSEKSLYTTDFMHWYIDSRDNLMSVFGYQQNTLSSVNWLKIGNAIEISIIEKMAKNNSLFDYLKKGGESNAVLNMRMMYWGKCFINSKKSNEYKTFFFANKETRNTFMAVMNSCLFFLFWENISDCWHITKQELTQFRFSLDNVDKTILSTLAETLEDDLEAKKEYVGTKQTDYEYYHKKSKPIIDEIDKVLARHYGFTGEELDFIINYDIKYRMGLHVAPDAAQTGGEIEGEE